MVLSKSENFDSAWSAERDVYFGALKNEIEDLKNKGIFDGKRIALLGAWYNAGTIKKIINELELELSIIADNNSNKHGVSRTGIICQSVESLLDESDIVILVVNNVYWKQISLQLESYGYVENDDFYILYGEKNRRLLEEEKEVMILDKEWEKYKTRAIKGYNAYMQIYEKYDKRTIWLMHQPSLGDLYIFSLFLPNAMGVKNIKDCNCVLIVVKNSVKKLAEILGFQYVEMISIEEATENWLVMMRIMGNQVDVHNAVFHGENGIFSILFAYSRVNFKDSYTNYVFGKVIDDTPCYPNFPKRKEIVRNIFYENDLIPGKTVLISPYASHFTANISQKQWNFLVSELGKKGYTIGTNCGGVEELPLEGTKGLYLDLADCVEFVEQAGYFIGIRSGFCDLLCMAQCQKIVIYEEGDPQVSIDVFGFDNMKLGRNIIEMEYDCNNTDQLINNILEKF